MGRKEIFEFFETRFGMDRKEFENLEFFERSKGRIFAMNKGSVGFLEKANAVSFGLLFCRKHGAIKPSSNIIQIFGKHAAKNVLELDAEKTKEYIKGSDLDIKDIGNCTDGYVILKYKNYPLGIGLLKNGKLKNMLQKGKRTKIELEPLASVKIREG